MVLKERVLRYQITWSQRRGSFFRTSVSEVYGVGKIVNTSKQIKREGGRKKNWLQSLKPYANFLNNWKEPCCDQDDFTEGDPSTSNYNRCEIAPYLPLKLHLKLRSCARKQHKEMLVSLLGDLSSRVFFFFFCAGVEVLIASAALIRWPLCFRRLYNINPSPTSAHALKGRWQAWHIQDLLMARALQCSR